MKIKLVLQDWRQEGEVDSIYESELGIELASGDLHSGTIFEAELIVNDDFVEQDIQKAFDKYKAYPVFSIIPKKENRE